MDLEGELGRVHEVEVNQEIFWKKYRETLLFLAARIMKSHRKGKKKTFKREEKPKKRSQTTRKKKRTMNTRLFFFHSNLNSEPWLDVLDAQTYQTRLISYAAIEVWTRGAGSRICVAQLSGF